MEWAHLFSSITLATAKACYEEGRVHSLRKIEDCYYATVVERKNARVSIDVKDDRVTGLRCSCHKASTGEKCKHMAAVLYAIEQTQMNEWEQEELDWDKLGKDPDDGNDETDCGTDQKETYTYFDFSAMQQELLVGKDIWSQAVRLAENGSATVEDVTIGHSSDKKVIGPIGIIEGRVQSGQQSARVTLIFDKNHIMRATCDMRGCNNYYQAGIYYGNMGLCVHETALFYLLGKYLKENNPGDATDRIGSIILASYLQKRITRVVSETGDGPEQLLLEPRLQRDFHGLSVSFRVGSGKLYVLKNLTDFVTHVESQLEMDLSPKVSLRMNYDSFTESGKQYYDFIRKAVEETRERMMLSAHGYDSEEVKGSIRLYGSMLDEFYDLIAGGDVEFTDGVGKEKKKGTLICGDKKPDIRMRIGKYVDEKGVFQGIRVTGEVPELIYGHKAAYYLDGPCLNRVDLNYIGDLNTLMRCTDGKRLEFTVGRKRMSEFYYTLLPWLRDFAQIEEEDQAEIERYLPPEVRFVFYLDIEERDITCRVEAVYGQRRISAMELNREGPQSPVPEEFRNRVTETEALACVRMLFPCIDKERDKFCCGGDTKQIFEVLESGVSRLISLGEVRSTERFRRLKIQRKPKVTLGVSVESGILNLTVTSQDISGEELLEAVRCYQKKQTYFQLKNGDFLKLETENIELLSRLMEDMRVSPGEFVRGKMKIPAYRALYLDKMLEKCAGEDVSRDRYFKKLVKEFKTVADSDFEVPESLRPIMRGYQAVGYKWLRTLDAYGFGGILADDMGLGKTLQAIAVLLAEKEEKKQGTSLVVAPASLVYNWGEELKRFAPQLRVCLVAGNQEARLDMIRSYESWDVMVTSYDLLKRDVAEYEQISFAYQILDEAQYIKNHQTAAAKAVKIIKSRTRYALTGTPIENRLSELWSIFEYLMPGFLYGYETFRKEFEAPIVKNGDRDAADRLKRMASPFILRRLKTDVLKDLPDKLEEVRFAGMEETQRRLYDGQVLHMQELIGRQDDENFRKNKMQVLAELTRVRQICCDPSLYLENYDGGSAKRDACMDLIRSAIEGEHKVLVFSQFTTMLELLERDLTADQIAYYKITGETPKEKRVRLVEQFNRDNTPVFLISLKAGGTGLNLTGADVVIHYDPWWNIAVQNQATDRTHRIGQTKVVTVYKLIMKDTVEEKILQMQGMKQRLSDDILGGETGGIGAMSREELMELLR